jgi:hypothetical protein
MFKYLPVAKPSHQRGKLLGIPSYVMGEKTQYALREERGWTHSLQC